jgi:hypothetical protein
VAAGEIGTIPLLARAMGLPGGRGSPIERRDCGQAACPSPALRPARLAASIASPPASARATASTPSDATSQPDWPLGSAGRTGAPTGWRQDSPTWLSVGGRRGSPATAGCSAGAAAGARPPRPVPGWVAGGRPGCWWTRHWIGLGRRRR